VYYPSNLIVYLYPFYIKSPISLPIKNSPHLIFALDNGREIFFNENYDCLYAKGERILVQKLLTRVWVAGDTGLPGP
jgi:hypothetical protein